MFGVVRFGAPPTLAAASAAAEYDAYNRHDDKEQDAHCRAHHKPDEVGGPLEQNNKMSVVPRVPCEEYFQLQ